MAPSSLSQPGISGVNPSMGMCTASYGMSGLHSGNTGMGSGMASYTGMSGMNSGMTGLSSLNTSMTGSFGMSPASSSPRYSSAGSAAGNQGKNTSGSSALDSLFAPELGHLQNKGKPSMNALQSQQAGMSAAMNPGMFFSGGLSSY